MISDIPMFTLPKMKNIHAMTQAWRAFSPSAFGELVVMALKMLTRTRNKVTRRAIRPWPGDEVNKSNRVA